MRVLLFAAYSRRGILLSMDVYRAKSFLQKHLPEVVLAILILVLTTIPALHIHFVLGDSWQGIMPTFTDETFYAARVQTIAKGNSPGGNPYFLEHANDPPLVVFGGVLINAVPQLLGLSFNTARAVNFVVWSLLFAATLYWLFRELRIPRWIGVFATVVVYIESYAHVWRPVNLQPVYPFYFLFYLALLRLIRIPSKRNIVFLGAMTGATFYLLAYLWQIAFITLGLLFLYALVRKQWPLLKAAFFAGLLGGVIGLPVPAYALWLSHTSPYFWESVYRLGLVNTHLPMAEIIYSGGWIGLVLAFLAILVWRARALREDTEFLLLSLFVAVSGLGLWVMQGSNLITGKLLETGEHVFILLQPWLLFSTVSIGVYLWKRRNVLSQVTQSVSIAVLMLLAAVNVKYIHQHASSFLPSSISHEAWQTTQLYAKPLAWLDDTEKTPVAVWIDPYQDLSSNFVIHSRHFTLYTWSGLMELMPEGEIRERYLVSQYFDNPDREYLKQDENANLYIGRHDFPHQAKTIERRIKICRILFFWDERKDCGVVPTPQSLLGDTFFADLETKFQTDIKPNIKAYLAKYHVTYILKDKVESPQYRPEILGAERVYSDDRYELWHL
jgi:hypothetical protein